MKVYLVQHGEAVSKAVDPDRPLSERGRGDVERVAGLLERADLRVAQTIHSGKTRARQTAEILAAMLSPDRAPGARDGLDPREPVAPVVNQIGDFTEDTMLVGHLPFMARLATVLLTADETRTVVSFQPGSVVCLERDETGGWQLLWMIRPELLG
jgi:phosphohistidine phosphatase